MENKESISPLQMASLVLVFTTGSSIIYIPSSLLSESRNGFWLALLIAGLCGAFALSCMLYLHRRYEGETLVDSGVKTIGSFLTAVLSIPFVGFMIMLSAYIYYSVGTFFTTTMMRETPNYVFNSLIALISVMTARAGIVVIGRMFSLVNIVLLGAVAFVLLLGIGHYKADYLLPVMPYGMKPIFHSVYQVTGFLYGDFLVFAMVLPFMRSKQGGSGSKTIIAAMVLNWVILVIVSLCIVMALGPVTNEFKYPIFSLARLISIQEIVERVESVIGMSLIAGSYMKSTITLFALNEAISRLFKLRNDGLLLLPLAALGLMLSLVIVRNESDFGEVLIIWPLITLVASLPLFTITVCSLFRKRAD